MSALLQNSIKINNGLSQKKIFRITEKKLNKILIDFTLEQKDFESFINTYQILKNLNISIPKVYEINFKKKIIIMEDFGDNTFDKINNEKILYDLLKLAVDNLIIIENSLCYDDLANLTKYKYSDLKKEISEFVEYYIPFKKIYNFSSDDFYNCWERVFEKNRFNFDSLTHKDFEFINLIFVNKNKYHLKCGIIDFQSAFVGFKGWDLFCVLENPRLNIDRKYNEELLKYFYDNVNIIDDFKLFRNQYYLLNLSRQTRLLGRWVKLFNEGKKEYLNYISTTQKRVISCLPNIHDTKLKKIYEKVISN